MSEEKKILDEKELDEITGGVRITKTQSIALSCETNINANSNANCDTLSETSLYENTAMGSNTGAGQGINVFCPKCQKRFKVPKAGKYQHHCGAKLDVNEAGIATLDLGVGMGLR